MLILAAAASRPTPGTGTRAAPPAALFRNVRRLFPGSPGSSPSPLRRSSTATSSYVGRDPPAQAAILSRVRGSNDAILGTYMQRFQVGATPIGYKPPWLRWASRQKRRSLSWFALGPGLGRDGRRAGHRAGERGTPRGGWGAGAPRRSRPPRRPKGSGTHAARKPSRPQSTCATPTREGARASGSQRAADASTSG